MPGTVVGHLARIIETALVAGASGPPAKENGAAPIVVARSVDGVPSPGHQGNLPDILKGKSAGVKRDMIWRERSE
jgi:hypothetical protein